MKFGDVCLQTDKSEYFEGTLAITLLPSSSGFFFSGLESANCFTILSYFETE